MSQDRSEMGEGQYERTKEWLLERGRSGEEAEEIAARTISEGEAGEVSDTPAGDISSGPRDGRSRHGSGGRTYDQLRNEAKARGIKGRSRMNKAELEQVLSR
jgi:hypothetical protein